MARDPNCTKCSLHQSSTHVCIWGTGEGEGFLVGEAPGRKEGKTGKPFMGEAGHLLRALVSDAGIVDPYITNAAKCRPPENRKPEPDEIAACKPYLLEEIAERKPKAILLLGATAMRSMLNRTGITQMNGQIVEKDGQTYVCAFHPAYILRDPSKEVALRMAIGRYAAVLKGTHSEEMPPWKPIDRSTFDQFVESWMRSTEIAFDVETAGDKEGEGLDWFKDTHQITSISFSLLVSGKEENWALAVDHPSRVLDDEFLLILLTELTRSCGGKKIIAHNGKFDNKCLMKRFGVRFPLTDDTQLLHHLIDENSYHGLKLLARQFCGAPDYDLSLKEKKNTRAVGGRRLLGYNASDTAYTRRLRMIFSPKMDAEERWLYEKVIIPASRHLERSEYNGLYVDLDFLNNTSIETQKKKLLVEAKLNKIAGRTINWNAPAQVAQVLYKDLGIVPTVFTGKKDKETGEDRASTGEEAIVDIDHPVAKLLEEYRGHEKFLSTYSGRYDVDTETYVGGWRDYMVGPHLYLPIKMIGTVTGRYSSRLHQTPRDGLIRNAVIAPPPWKFGQLDLSQAELRVVAILSRDHEMLECFHAGKDIHWRTLMETVQAGGGEYVDLVMKTARALTKRKLDFTAAIQLVHEYGQYDPELAVKLNGDWKEARKKAKGINFGFVFDQSPQGFITYAKTKYGFEPTLEEATTFHNAYFNLYRDVPRWHDRQRSLVKQDGFVRSMSGRKRRLPGIYSSDRSVRSECERQAINSPVQGFIGDYKAMILVELMDVLPWEQFRVVGEVHDSILFWYKDESILSDVKKIAENPRLARECGLKFPIKMAVDIELGRWGAGRKWKGA